jgi:hypothetical protein
MRLDSTGKEKTVNMLGFELANLRSLGDLIAGIRIDSGLFHFYHIGLGVGLVILSTLILFPGRG